MSRRVIAVAIAAAMLLVIVWIVAVKGPQSKAIKRAHAQQTAAAQQVATLQAQAASLLQQTAGLPAIQAQLAALKVALPPKAALDQVIDEIHQASGAAGVGLATLSQGVAPTSASAATPGAGELQQVNLAMTVQGTYAQLMDYLNKLNQLARTTVVDNLTLAVGDTGQMSAQITSRTFFAPTGS